MAPGGPWMHTEGLILSAQPPPSPRRPTGRAGISPGASWPGPGPTVAAGGFSTATGACTPLEGLLRSLRAPTGPDGTSRRASRGPAPAQALAAEPRSPAGANSRLSVRVNGRATRTKGVPIDFLQV